MHLLLCSGWTPMMSSSCSTSLKQDLVSVTVKHVFHTSQDPLGSSFVLIQTALSEFPNVLIWYLIAMDDKYKCLKVVQTTSLIEHTRNKHSFPISNLYQTFLQMYLASLQPPKQSHNNIHIFYHSIILMCTQLELDLLSSEHINKQHLQRLDLLLN